jgi:cytochrome c oxidase assembly protein subunit 15
MVTPSPSIAPRRTAFGTAARVTLVLVYMVIIAGSVVRSTGAGMGCPDWPKCFGHYIPPTDISELQYQQGRHFKSGYFIIWQNALWKAKRDLVATATIDPNDWEKYTKHDYATFNAAHTWTEYINRLTGVSLGIAAMVMVAVSFGSWRRDRTASIASIAALALIGFEGWLGALVVESKLAPVKITAHMVVALAIVALVVWIVRRARGTDPSLAPAVSRGTMRLLVGCLALTLAQILLGSQVREQVDLVAVAMGDANRPLWIDQLGTVYYVHRSFAWTLLFGNGLLALRLWRESMGSVRMRRLSALLAVLLVASVGTGIVLSRMAMPAAMQPAHLLLGTILFGVQFSTLLESRRRRAQSARVEPAPRIAVAEAAP